MKLVGLLIVGSIALIGFLIWFIRRKADGDEIYYESDFELPDEEKEKKKKKGKKH